jgi:catecholate siderophore receptor
MSFNATIKPAALAVLAALGTISAVRAAETTLPQINVQAQSERADGPVDGYRAERSATFTKTDTPLKDVPASVTVVPAELMKDQAMQSMGDVFRYVPGTLMHQGEGNRDQVIIRGNSTTADFFVNGVRDDAQIFRDLYNLERAEVLKGPGGMAFGRGGAGGVVNLVTKKPLFDRIGEASLTLGSFNQVRGTIDYGDKLGESAAFRINAMTEDADSFRQGVDMQRYAFNPTLALKLTARTLLTFSYERLRDDRTADRGIPSQNGRPFDTATSSFFGNPGDSHARANVDNFAATLAHEFGGSAKLSNTFRAAHYDKLYQNIYAGSAVNDAGLMQLAAYNNLNRRNNFFNQTDLTQKFSYGGVEHTLLAGAEIGHQRSDNRRNTGFLLGSAARNGNSPLLSASAPFSVVTRWAPGGAAIASDADNLVRAQLAAAYLQDQISLAPQWKLLVGARFDHFKTFFDDRRAPSGNPPTQGVDLGRTDNAWSPRAGLIWNPTAASTVYTSYSSSFLPSAEQLSLAATTANLAPETAKNYEVGARWDVLPKLTLSGAVFKTYKDNVRVSDPANPAVLIKTGQLLTDGFEVGLQGDVTKNWQVYGGYASLDGRTTKPTNSGTGTGLAAVIPAGNKTQLTPNNTFSLWNKFAHGGGWGTGFGAIYQDQSFTSLDNTVKLPAFWRFDGAVYYAFAGGKARLALNVENMFNKKYYPTADGNNNISSGAPVNARLTLSTFF